MKKKILSFLLVLTLTFICTFSLCGCKTEAKYKAFAKAYSINEIKNIEANSFKRLNTITYPETINRYFAVSEEFKKAVGDMAFKVYEKASEGKTDNFAFSPLGLYENLSVVSLCSDDEAALKEIDALLGTTKETRKQDYINAYKTDYFAYANGKLQMYNGAFFTNEFAVNNEVISALSDYYTEAFQLDFKSDKDVNKMLDWVNGKVGEKNFVDKDFLEIDSYTAAFFFTTLDFDGKWMTSFDTANSNEGTFYGASKESRVTFMIHSYYGDCYDYGDYITCYDYYGNGLKIKYIVPLDKTSNIFELVKGVNFIEDDQTRKIQTPVNEYGEQHDVIVNLKMPKFDAEYTFDFTDTLKELGVKEAFNKLGDTFNYTFPDMKDDYFTYLKFVKQKNKASFSEDGTTVKSVTVAQMGKNNAAAPMIVDTINVDLDRPFIYVIYDPNDLPIYVGNVNDL